MGYAPSMSLPDYPESYTPFPCADDPELWFADKGPDQEWAKRICFMRCTVRQSCLEYALRHDERFGVWGGFNDDERQDLLGRPRRRSRDRIKTQDK